MRIITVDKSVIDDKNGAVVFEVAGKPWNVTFFDDGNPTAEEDYARCLNFLATAKSFLEENKQKFLEVAP